MNIAARGLDGRKIPVVINFDLPRSPSDYMHRIGRKWSCGIEVVLALSFDRSRELPSLQSSKKNKKFVLSVEQVEESLKWMKTTATLVATLKTRCATGEQARRKRKHLKPRCLVEALIKNPVVYGYSKRRLIAPFLCLSVCS
ncbi:helicase-related protein [Vibrio lentus]|nr:helicase-related protein [Vibrio lentus]